MILRSSSRNLVTDIRVGILKRSNIALVASRMLSSQWRPDSCWLASTVVVVIAGATRGLFTRMVSSHIPSQSASAN
jgi:hypothetical protein